MVNIDSLWEQIHYCNLLLEGAVTEPALLLVCKEILQERGTLPVGEIGKVRTPAPCTSRIESLNIRNGLSVVFL